MSKKNNKKTDMVEMEPINLDTRGDKSKDSGKSKKGFKPWGNQKRNLDSRRSNGSRDRFSKHDGGFKHPGSARVLPEHRAASAGWNQGFVQEGDKFSISSFNTNAIPGTDNGILSQNKIIDLTPQADYPATWNFNVNQTAMANPMKTSGVMALWLQDYLGCNNNEERSALNRSCIKHKLYIDTALGVQTTFNAADMAIYFGAVKSLYDLIKVAKRTINLSRNPRNLSGYQVNGMYKAMRVSSTSHSTTSTDPQWSQAAIEIATFAINYIDRLNNAIELLNTVKIPAELANLLSYTDPTYTAIYKDADNDNAQYYVFMPTGWYEYDEESDPNGACLTWHTFYNDLGSNHVWSVPDLIEKIEELTIKLTNGTDSREISQKLLNAYGTENLYQLPTYAAVDIMCPVVYDESVKHSIINATLLRDLEEPHYAIDPMREIVFGRPTFHLTQLDSDNLWNLPLQFTDDPSAITIDMVSAALKFHPVAGYSRKIMENGSFKYHEVDFGNAFGFQLLTEIDVIGLIMDGTSMIMDEKKYSNRRLASVNDLVATFDFKWVPLFISTTTPSPSSSSVSTTLAIYTGRRETEVTITLNNIEYWFRAESESVWASNTPLNLKGQRTVLG